MKNEEFITARFHDVKNLGWVKSNRHSKAEIGETFMDCIKVLEKDPGTCNLAGYEVKDHRMESASYVTLFAKSPSFPKRGAIAYLKDKFGTPYDDNTELNKLHTAVSANSYNTYAGTYSFRLINDRENGRIHLAVYTLDHELIDKTVYYTYDDIKHILNRKLNNLFYAEAERRFENGDEYIRFTSAEIYSEPSFERFLEMVDNGDIRYNIRIGCYQSGEKYGKPYDHGSGFRIKEYNIRRLYSTRKRIQ